MNIPKFKVAKTRIVQIKDLKQHPDNPRFIRDLAFDRLKKSMSEFPGMSGVKPIVCNKDNVILAGSMRVRAAKALGWKEIPTTDAEFDTPEQELEFIIKDNTHFGEFDMDIIGNEWANQPLEDWGIYTYDVYFSGSNKEIDMDGLGTDMTLKLTFSESVYAKVNAALSKIAATPEQSVIELLKL